jgi:hypothetical protein
MAMLKSYVAPVASKKISLATVTLGTFTFSGEPVIGLHISTEL